jgi:hypothetical protein
LRRTSDFSGRRRADAGRFIRHASAMARQAAPALLDGFGASAAGALELLVLLVLFELLALSFDFEFAEESAPEDELSALSAVLSDPADADFEP